MHEIMISRLKARIAAKGTNPTKVSTAAGLGKTAVRDILAGKSKSPNIDTLERIAKVLDCTASYLIAEFEDPQKVRVETATPDVQLKQAAYFLEAGVFRKDPYSRPSGKLYPVYDHPEYIEHSLELYIAADDSMAAIGIIKGDLITAAYPFSEHHLELVDEMLIVVSRTVSNQNLTEFTARQVVSRRGGIELHSRAPHDDGDIITMKHRIESPHLDNRYISSDGNVLAVEGIIVRVTRDIPKAG